MPYYLSHLESATSLVTQKEKTTLGFIASAMDRNGKASVFVNEARNVRMHARQASCPSDLAGIKAIQKALLAAAGVSDKAKVHLKENGCRQAIEGFIHEYLEPAGDQFVDELVFRFLLTRGDTLGGSMRNHVGVSAQQKLHAILIDTLTDQSIDYNIHDGQKSVKAIEWKIEGRHRKLWYNIKVPFIGKKGNNVDMALTNELPLANKAAYLAFGELKGGIDPAGADEHWKTANSALKRIRESFEEAKLFYVGAAIEESMSHEIWSHLNDGHLANAANLTDKAQIKLLCQWFLTL